MNLTLRNLLSYGCQIKANLTVYISIVEIPWFCFTEIGPYFFGSIHIIVVDVAIENIPQKILRNAVFDRIKIRVRSVYPDPTYVGTDGYHLFLVLSAEQVLRWLYPLYIAEAG